MKGKPHSPSFTSAAGEARFQAAYDAALKLWTVPFEERDLPTSYGSTHVIVTGEPGAPPLVLLHCALMTSAIWSPIIAELSREYRCYAVDVMGDIGRTVPTNPPKSEEEFADWLVQTFDALELDKARVLAWSFGGFVATNFSIRHPARVEKLALVAPFATFQRPSVRFLWGFVPFLIRTRGGAAVFERKMCFRGSFGHREHAEILYERYRSGKMAMKVGPRVFKDDELGGLPMPLLLLVGRQELLYDGPAAVRRAGQVLRHGDVELLEECNHGILSDRTERVRERVLGFLGE